MKIPEPDIIIFGNPNVRAWSEERVIEAIEIERNRIKEILNYLHNASKHSHNHYFYALNEVFDGE